MRECDNSKIHIHSNFLLSICLIIMLDTLLLTYYYYLLLQNCYDNYCCHGGKTNEHYFLTDLTNVQALHSSHQSLYIQGGSNMTRTNLCVNKINQSRSYLNHLVY